MSAGEAVGRVVAAGVSAGEAVGCAVAAGGSVGGAVVCEVGASFVSSAGQPTANNVTKAATTVYVRKFTSRL